MKRLPIIAAALALPIALYGCSGAGKEPTFDESSFEIRSYDYDQYHAETGETGSISLDPTVTDEDVAMISELAGEGELKDGIASLTKGASWDSVDDGSGTIWKKAPNEKTGAEAAEQARAVHEAQQARQEQPEAEPGTEGIEGEGIEGDAELEIGEQEGASDSGRRNQGHTEVENKGIFHTDKSDEEILAMAEYEENPDAPKMCSQKEMLRYAQECVSYLEKKYGTGFSLVSFYQAPEGAGKGYLLRVADGPNAGATVAAVCTVNSDYLVIEDDYESCHDGIGVYDELMAAYADELAGIADDDWCFSGSIGAGPDSNLLYGACASLAPDAALGDSETEEAFGRVCDRARKMGFPGGAQAYLQIARYSYEPEDGKMTEDFISTISLSFLHDKDYNDKPTPMAWLRTKWLDF